MTRMRVRISRRIYFTGSSSIGDHTVPGKGASDPGSTKWPEMCILTFTNKSAKQQINLKQGNLSRTICLEKTKPIVKMILRDWTRHCCNCNLISEKFYC